MFCAEVYEHPPITSLTPDAKVFCTVRAFSEGSAYAKGFCAVAGSSKWYWASNLLLMMCCDDEASLSFTEASLQYFCACRFDWASYIKAKKSGKMNAVQPLLLIFLRKAHIFLFLTHPPPAT